VVSFMGRIIAQNADPDNRDVLASLPDLPKL